MAKYVVREIVADYTINPEIVEVLLCNVNTNRFEKIAVPSIVMLLSDVIETMKVNIPADQQAQATADIVFRVLMYLFADDELITELEARTKLERKQERSKVNPRETQEKEMKTQCV